ncbi:hypothetical protein II906_05380 [bacterium]|nr:hypothetical protein [bacterium]
MIIVLTIIYSSNSYAQNRDSIISIFIEVLNQDRASLMNCRSNNSHTLIVCDDRFPENFYSTCDISIYNNSIVQGVDLSPRGWMSDSLIQARILQLLRGEFYDGELDALIAEEFQKDEYSTLSDSAKQVEYVRLEKMFMKRPNNWWTTHLVNACQFVNDKKILNRIEEMYLDTAYNYCKEELLRCLLANNIEPYTSDILKKSKYNKRQDEETQFNNIVLLQTIHNQKALKELSEYLLSEAYYTMHICDDKMPIKDTIPNGIKNSIVEDDHIEDCIEDTLELVEYESQDDGDGIEEQLSYHFTYAFFCIQLSIDNEDLYSMLGIKNDNGVDEKFLTIEVRHKIHKWMQKNYGKYKIKNRWNYNL